MNSTRLRTMIAGGLLGAVALAGLAGGTMAVAGATGTDSASEPAAATAPVEHPRLDAAWDRLSTDDQACLEGEGVTRPEGAMTREELKAWGQQLATAADTCDINIRQDLRVKARQAWAELTPEQRQCVKDQDLTRPVGRLDKAERQQLRADLKNAADTCGIEVPTASAVPVG